MSRTIADAIPRGRIVTTGTIREMTTVRIGGTPSPLLLLDDGSGKMGLHFVGRPAIPGLTKGARCTIEGTAGVRGGRLVVWNPKYRLEPDDE